MMDLVQQATIAFHEDRVDDSVRSAKLLAIISPEFHVAWFILGSICNQKYGDLRLALRLFARSEQLSDEFEKSKLEQGKILLRLDRLPEAEKIFVNLINNNKNVDELAYSELCCLLLHESRNGEARNIANMFIEIYKDSAFAYYTASYVLAKCGHWETAASLATNAVALDPSWPLPVALRGMMLWRLGRLPECRQALSESILVASNKIGSAQSDDRLTEINRRWRQVRQEAKNRLGIGETEPAYFIVLTEGLGDQFLCLGLIGAFKREFSKYKVIIICPPLYKWEIMFENVADLFFQVSPSESRDFLNISRFCPDHPYVLFFPWIGSFVGLFSLADIGRFVLGLSPQEDFAPPASRRKERRNGEELFERLGGKPGRSVLVSNISNSNPTNSTLWWSALVDELIDQGFVVFQNATNKNKPGEIGFLPNATLVDLPVELAIPFCEKAGFFIGMRSGLCDLLSQAHLRKKAVFVKRCYPPHHRYPLTIWQDENSGVCMRQITNSELWEDVELKESETFDKRIIQNWIEAP